jgi:hypothetical protein
MTVKRLGQKTGHITSRSTSNPVSVLPEIGPGVEGRNDAQGQTSSNALPATIVIEARADAGVGTRVRTAGHGSEGETAADDIVPIHITVTATSLGREEGQGKTYGTTEDKEMGQGSGQGQGQGDSSPVVAAAGAAVAAAAVPASASYWSIITESVRAPAATFFSSLYSYSYACLPKILEGPSRATNLAPTLGIQVQVPGDDDSRVLQGEGEGEGGGEGRSDIAVSHG